MSDLKITVGGDVIGEARQAFIDAWSRGERGEDTAKRAALIGYVRRHEVTSIRRLSTALGRNESDVRADVEALAAVWLLDTSGGRIRADYGALDARITF